MVEELKEEQKSFSVIVPAYNCDKVITRTLESIYESVKFFQNNYPHSHNVKAEIVVVNDNSTDNTLGVIVNFARDKPDLFKVVGHKINKGAGAARNTGVKYSQGEILFFCDGDDLFLPPHIYICFLVLQGKIQDFTNFQISNSSQRLSIQLSDNPPDVIRTGVTIQEKIHPSWKAAIENSLPLNLCVKRKCHDFVEGFPEDEVFKKLGSVEDTTYQRYLATFFKVAKINFPTVEYIRYPGNSLDKQMPKFELPFGEFKGILPHEEGKTHLFQEAHQIGINKLNYLKGKLTNSITNSPQIQPQNELKQYQFTQDWFSINIPIWQQFLTKFAGLPNLNFLEIGSWEGRSTCWLLDNILTHKSAKITCIDTFEGAIKHQTLGEQFLKSVESRFEHDIRETGSSEKVQKIVGFSQEELRKLPFNSYDLIYIDGSHLGSVFYVVKLKLSR